MSFWDNFEERKQKAKDGQDAEEDLFAETVSTLVNGNANEVAKMAAGQYADGAIVSLSMDDLIPLEDNPYDPKNEEDLKNLANDIKENGLLHELIVREHPKEKEKYQILCGSNRYRACKDILGMESILCKFRVCHSESEAYSIAVRDNEKSRKPTPVERARAIALRLEKIKEDNAYGGLAAGQEDLTEKSHETVAKEFDIHESDVYRWKNANNLTEAYKDLFRDGELKLAAATILGSMDEESQERVFDATSGKKLTQKQAQAAKDFCEENPEAEQDTLKEAILGSDKKPEEKFPKRLRNLISDADSKSNEELWAFAEKWLAFGNKKEEEEKKANEPEQPLEGQTAFDDDNKGGVHEL